LRKRLKKYLTKLAGRRLNLWYEISPEKAIKKSIDYFLSPRQGKINGEIPLFLTTANQTEKINIEDKNLQTYIWKRGNKKVLLAHGWESNSSRWEKLIEKLLEENFTVISIDAPAHGKSEGEYSNVPLYGKAIDFLVRKYEINYAIGHSLGGFTLLFQQYQKEIPYLEKMILLAPATEMKNILNGFQQTLGLKNTLMQGMENYFEEKFKYSLSDFSILKLVKENPIPTLFIHDKEDRIVNYQESKNIVNQWKNSELVLTQGLRHGLKGEYVIKIIIEYLKREIQIKNS